MMKHISLFLTILLVAGFGCGKDAPKPSGGPPDYVSPTSPPPSSPY